MRLPVMPPVQPMLAKSVKGVPDPAKHEGGLSYEPKWDGFRCIVFRDGDEVALASRNTKELTRYFPEVVEAVKESVPERCVLDGEIFVAIGERLEFERLQERIHPAESRITMLAERTPASFVAFDILALGDEDLMGEPFSVRRTRLEEAMAHTTAPVYLTRTTTDPAEAEDWFGQFEGAGLDGVVAKPLRSPYQPNARTMLKVKHERTADVVVAGYRLHKTSTPAKPLLGSLLLGLYDDRGNLVGAFIVEEGDEVLSVTSSGQVVRSPINDELRPKGRSTMGVTFVKLRNGDIVSAVARSVERAAEIEEAAAQAEAETDAEVVAEAAEQASEAGDATIGEDGAAVPSNDVTEVDLPTEES